jgi:major membrane immunogen (membrane-anchored lipoprotein)
MKKLVILGVISLSILFTYCKKEDKDEIAPIITLEGTSPQYVAKDSTYIEPGYTAIDDVDGDISDLVKVKSDVNTAIEGTYNRTYNVIDKSGNSAEEVKREVIVMIF